MRFMIGLHAGEPIREADDFYSEALTSPRGSEILVPSLVRDLVESFGEFSFSAPTDAELKGLSGMHRLSAVEWQG
jgi:adenylate cyclase